MKRVDWDSPEFKSLDPTERLIAIAASAAELAYDNGDGVIPESPEEVDEGGQFLIPLLIPEELESGDGRKMDKNALSTRNLPISLLWQPATGDGHNGSYVVGRIDSIERVEAGLGNARGVFDTGPYGREAERLVRAKMLRGVSADLDMFEATVDADGNELAEGDSFDPNKIKNEKMTVNKARVMAATLVAKPAFQECTIELVSEDNMSETPLEDGVYEEARPEIESADFALSTIIASAAPVNPPLAWFENPSLDGPTPLTVDDDGRVFGHIATWDTDHVGFNTRVRPPRSRTNYAYFRTGLVKTIEGEDVAVGQLTLLGGHAPLDADAHAAVKHYDDTASAVADVAAGEDQFGIWVSGALRPGVTPEQVRVFRASAPSGDWRPINGQLELVAVCQVNVPGFPVARARVASGAVMALVAAGAQTLHKIRKSETDELAMRLSAIETQLLAQRKAELAADFDTFRQERLERLKEAAANARAVMAPEFDRRAELAARAEELKKEFKLQVAPDFKEALHPRDEHGKWRKVLLRLNEVLKSEGDNPDANEAKAALEKAADLEDKGDAEGARAAGEEAKAKLESAADKADAENPADGGGAELHDAASEVDDATKAPDAPAADKPKADAPMPKADAPMPDAAPKADAPAPADKPGGGGSPLSLESLTRGDVPPEILDLIDMLVDELGEGVDPQTVVSRLDSKAKHWIEGAGFKSPEDMMKVVEKLMIKPIQPGIGQ